MTATPESNEKYTARSIRFRRLSLAKMLEKKGENVVYILGPSIDYYNQFNINPEKSITYSDTHLIEKLRNQIGSHSNTLVIIANSSFDDQINTIENIVDVSDKIVISIKVQRFETADLLHKIQSKNRVITYYSKTDNPNHILIRAEKASPLNISSNVMCTGCGACFDICKFGAIEMGHDNHGYLKPMFKHDKCKNCKQCIDVCPVISPKPTQTDSPTGYALKAEDDIWKNSASGGAFSLLATEVLSRGGIVYGAKWDDEPNVVIDYVHSTSELNQLKFSKYVQSTSYPSYPNVKKNLETGCLVLYSGLSCQISALKKYLGKDYPNLITIDLICRGVPSMLSLKKYLLENDSNEVKKVINRIDKTNARITKVVMSNGATILLNDEDKYVNSLFAKRWLFGKDACKYCYFANMPRQGDITIGDFWDIKKFNREYPDPGTSLVLCNTSKGRELFESIRNNCEKLDSGYDYLKTHNRIVGEATFDVKKSMEFYDYLESHTFSETFNHMSQNNVDVGIVSIDSKNYGNHLTMPTSTLFWLIWLNVSENV